MKNIKKIIIFSMLISAPLLLHSQENAAGIMEKSRDAMKVESFEAVASLNIVDSKGRVRERTNITASKSYDDGTEKRLIKFLSPADVEGTAMLIHDYNEGQDDMWIYLPALNRTRRIVSSEKGKSFMGSEFTNADMSSPPASDFHHSIVEESGDLYIIESRPVSRDREDEYGFSRKVSAISKDNYTVSRMDFYNSYDELYKTIHIKDMKELGNGSFIVSHMTAENFSNGRSSEIVMEEIRSGTDINDDLFNVASLGR